MSSEGKVTQWKTVTKTEIVDGQRKITTIRTRTTTKTNRSDGITIAGKPRRVYKQNDHSIFAQFSGKSKKNTKKKKKSTKTFKERQEEKLAASNAKLKQRKEEREASKLQLAAKERQREEQEASERQLAAKERQRRKLERRQAKAKKQAQQPPRITSTQRNKLLEKREVRKQQPPRIPSSKRKKLLKKKTNGKSDDLKTLMGRVKGIKQPATDGTRKETLQNTIKAKLKPSKPFVKVESSTAKITESLPFQMGEKVCILSGQRAGEVGTVTGFNNRTNMFELRLRFNEKYFRPASALSTHTQTPPKRNDVRSTNLSNVNLIERAKNVPSPRPARQVPRRKKIGSDDMSSDATILIQKVKSLPTMSKVVPPRREDIRSTNLTNVALQDRLKRVPRSPGRKAALPPRREDLKSVHIRNSVLLRRVKKNKSSPSLRTK